MMKKNAQIHLLIESEVVDRIKKEAEEKSVSWSEICRQRLRHNPQLDRIEFMIKEIEEKVNKKEVKNVQDKKREKADP